MNARRDYDMNKMAESESFGLKEMVTGAMRDLESETVSSVDNETLMNCVREYRCVYDRSCLDFTVLPKKKTAWQEIAKKLRIEVSMARTRYDTIRTAFSKYLKRVAEEKASETGRYEAPELREDLEYLRWLIPHIKHRRQRSNVNRPASQHQETISQNSFGESKGLESFDESAQDNSMAGRSEAVFLPGHQVLYVNMNSQEAGSEGGYQEFSSSDEDNAEDDADCSVKDEFRNCSASTSCQNTDKTNTRKRSWTKVMASDNMNGGFMKTMSALGKAISSPESEEMFDEDLHFCLSLVGQLKRLEPKFKSTAKLQIMHVMHNMEIMRTLPQLPRQHFERTDPAS